jgi:hypothetical protein
VEQVPPNARAVRLRAVRVWGVPALLALATAWLLVLPAAAVVRHAHSAGLESVDAPPRLAFRWHRRLSPRYARWARTRLEGREVRRVAHTDTSGTEWPLFSAAFYLVATADLAAAHRADPTLWPEPPGEYAAASVEAAAALLADPDHAEWVRAKYGDEYLTEQNCFYRMLRVMGFASHESVLANGRYTGLLAAEAEDLAGDITEAPHVLLDDYPWECYPSDVLWAVAAVRRADVVLGTDHSELARLLMRRFDGPLLTPDGIPPYSADRWTGEPHEARGCSNSAILNFAPELDAGTSARWYGAHASGFWQQNALVAGFREFPSGRGSGFYVDIDAGPVLWGYGVAASAFGLGAARANGRVDHAAALLAEMVACAWPLPGGTLLVPRLLSDAVDAPYLGEAAILFNLTRTRAAGVQAAGRPGAAPLVAWLLPLVCAAVGVAVVAREALSARRQVRAGPRSPARERAAFLLWIALLAAAAALLALGHPVLAVVAVLLAGPVPAAVADGLRLRRRRGPREPRDGRTPAAAPPEANLPG